MDRNIATTVLRLHLRRNRWVQAAMVVALWAAMQGLVSWLGLPLPAGVVGLALLLVLLVVGWVPAAWFGRGSNHLLDHMLLFFVPATMTLLDHHELFGKVGLEILAVIVIGTVSVMAGTALAVEACFRWSERRAR